MEILIGDKGNLDFNAPIKVTEIQKYEIIKFFESVYKVVEIEKAEEFRTERIGDKFFPREWTEKEYEILFEIENTEKVSEMLGRSWMSVDIRRGIFLPDFLEWGKRNNKDLIKGNIKEYIKKFIKEKRDILILKKQQKKKERNELANIEHELKSLPGRRKMIQVLINIGQCNIEDLEKLDEKEVRLKEKLKFLKEKLN